MLNPDLLTHKSAPQTASRTSENRSFPIMTATENGLHLTRYFTTAGVDPLSEEAGIKWEKRTATITGMNGELIFEQKDVEVPVSWSQTATNIVVNKYFRGATDTPDRETSIRQLVSRVANTITGWGERRNYFATPEDVIIFRDELTHLLVTQKAAFNSPVWFNVGVEPHPQCSACFINSVDDKMEAILGLAKTEGMLFKYGSGTGTNLSTLRSSKERLSNGGRPSGPVSFMRGFDAFAGVIKSGGKTRRAAKMVILDVEHPDIEEFVDCKRKEEEKAWALIDAGYDGGFNVEGGAYDSVFFQNANHSVRVTDTFMRAVEADTQYNTLAVKDKRPIESKRARTIWRKMADAAWLCGDPGVQFDTTINKWHTCKESGRINSSNPCSEYMFLDDSACNLASMNLMKFRNEDGTFDTHGYRVATSMLILAQDIIVDDSSYPTEKIAKNSHDYRPLGLGYANLGALLMAEGLPYDSDEGRSYAAALTALMGGEAYAASAIIAQTKGAFSGYHSNAVPFMEVIENHRDESEKIDAAMLPDRLIPVLREAQESWGRAVGLGLTHGFRNSQVTVLAPTGTIGFMMDCDTTGVEPDIALVKYKKLVGGGMIKIVNQTVPLALDVMGYSHEEKEAILAYIETNETIEGAPQLKASHIEIFDCAFKAANGERSIMPMGHVRMMAAVQPFLSGAISKTVNMPFSATVEDIEDIYFQAWKLGVKAVAIYRDGCKRSQPLSTGAEEDQNGDVATGPAIPVDGYRPVSLEDLIEAAKDMNAEKELGQKLGMIERKRLPDERVALTHKFSIAGHEGYITVGLFEDGTPGEVFCTMSKEGSTISGLMDAFATAVSLALQYGVPMDVLVRKFSHTRFEPSGFTGNKNIPIAKSVTDYIFRWLGYKFVNNDETALKKDELAATNVIKEPDADEAERQLLQKAQDIVVKSNAEIQTPKVMSANPEEVFQLQADAPPCHDCGSIMIRNGACYKCLNCGSTSGCS